MKEEYAKILNLLVREPNLSLAAEHLCVSQSNLSKIIKKMEEEWEIKLFERKGFKGLQPTPEAVQLSQKMNLLLKEWKTGLTLLKNKKNERPDLRVVGPQVWLQNFFVPYWYQSGWKDSYRLVLTMLPLSELNLLSLGGHVDVIISNSSALLEDYVIHKLYRESFMIIFNKKYAPKSLDALDPTLYQWIGYSPTQDPLRQFFLDRRIDLQLLHSYVNDLRTQVALVKNSNEKLAACVPNHLVDSGIKAFEYKSTQGRSIEQLDLYYFVKQGHPLGRDLYRELKEYCTVNKSSYFAP